MQTESVGSDYIQPTFHLRLALVFTHLLHFHKSPRKFLDLHGPKQSNPRGGDFSSCIDYKTTETLSYKTTNPEEEGNNRESRRRGRVIIVPRKIRFFVFLKGKLKIRLLSPHCFLISLSQIQMFCFVSFSGLQKNTV